MFKRNFIKFENHVKFKIQKSEQKNDRKRTLKLVKLKKSKNFQPASITVFNETSTEIPKNVLNALSLGLDIGIGGSPNRVRVMGALEQMFQHWERFAEIQRLSPFQILDCKSRLLVEYGNLF